MFIDFEGIDGSGKTTLSNRLAQRLRKLGYRVTHAREGGELKARVSQRIRDLTRDPQLLELSPRAEFLLNLARDAQQLDEVVKPALARAEVCITDRYVPSQLALAHGRGLPGEELEAAVKVASQDVWPDLVILVDVEPELARLRKRLGKIQEERDTAPTSRKGLAGSGLAARARESFLAQARADPSRWLVVSNDEQPLWVLEQRILEAVLARLEKRELPVQPIVPPVRTSPAPGTSARALGERFFHRLDTLEIREPSLAAYLLAGVRGRLAHQRRLTFAERFPALVARGLRGLDDDDSFALREWLATRAPAEVALSLPRTSGRARVLRARLIDTAPRPVVEGLSGDGSDEAWALRDRALAKGELEAVLRGLAGEGSPRAWTLREVGLSRGLAEAVAVSLEGLGDARADGMREAMRAQSPLAALRSVHGLDSPLARTLREELLERATKPVMESLRGLDSEHASTLRERVAARAPEAVESLVGLDDERAWTLREAHADRWPSAAVRSLGARALSPRGQALLARVLRACPDRLPVLRDAYVVTLDARWKQEQAGRSVPAPAYAEAQAELP